MRLNTLALGLCLPIAAVLAGCGVGNVATSSDLGATTHKISGKAYGGQFPVTGATIAVYTYGSAGYGSTGTILATSVTDSSGYFNIDPSAINCPTPATPVYIVSIGGNPGIQNNSAIFLSASLGSCAGIADAFVTINEVSTAAMAYTFSHFFTAGSSDGTASDHFGAPADATQVVVTANSSTLPTLIDTQNSYPRPNTGSFTFEGAKLITLANIIGACVNSEGPGSPACTTFFTDVTPPGGAAPTNTLEAAVDLALNPAQNVQSLFALQPASGFSAFDGGLTSAPADWTLSASYSTGSFGLGVNTRTTSTIDIDTSGRIWFPSNRVNNVGIGVFDPSSASFSQLYNAGLQHPQQVAIDVDGFVWANDTAGSNVSGFDTTNPGNYVTLSLPGSTSTAVTTAFDNSMRIGVVLQDGAPGLAQITNKSNYSLLTEIPGVTGFIASSLAADVIGGVGIGGQELSTPTTYDLYYAPNGQITPITYQTFQDAGQVVFAGNNFVGTRGGYAPGADGICLWSTQACYGMANDGIRHPSGLSLDGTGALWLADTNTNSIEQIPSANGSYLNAANQANNTVYVHDANNGNTLPSPAGIAIDRAGNVWVSNAGCVGDGCSASNFVLTEIVGAGAPTITPVSRQVVINNLAGTEPARKTTTQAAH